MKLYKDAKGFYVLELWGASTKHPDSMWWQKDFKFPCWIDKENATQEEIDGQVFQWLCEVASRLMIPIHAEKIIEYAWNNWRVWRKDVEVPTEDELPNEE